MPDLPISGLPAVTTLSGSFITAVVSGSVTSQMTVKQIGDAYSSSISTFPYTGSALITGSLGVTGSLSVSGSITAVNNLSVSRAIIANSAGNMKIGAGSNASTSGTGNIGVGDFALSPIGVGSYNIAIGRSAQSGMTSGSFNVAMGYNALQVTPTLVDSTGNYNTAIGNYSMQYIGQGSYNVAVGHGSLAGVSPFQASASYNVAIGVSASFSASSGTNNITVGYQAGSQITTGNYNTILGSFTGSAALSNTIVLADGQGNIGYRYSGSRAEITGSISQTSVTSSLIKANANGTLVAAVGGTDYTPPAYLSAFHTASLTVPSPNTPNTMSFSTVDFSQGVTVSGSWNDKIKMTNGGVYNLQFSAATTKTTGTSATVDIWLRKNESDLSYTNTIVTLAGGANDFAVPAWNFFVSASAGDYYQLMFASPTTNPYIAYSASGSTGVAVQVPSVILTVNRVG